MEITWGRGGWVSVDGIGLPGLLYLRIGRDGAPYAMYVAGSAPLTAKQLRTLPLTRITSVVNSRPDLLLAGGISADPAELRLPDLGKTFEQVVPRRRKGPGADTTARLSPPTAGLDDAFLQNVARAYIAAVARGERPNKSLAEQTQTPVRTVERWVYLARKSHFLASTKTGAVG